MKGSSTWYKYEYCLWNCGLFIKRPTIILCPLLTPVKPYSSLCCSLKITSLIQRHKLFCRTRGANFTQSKAQIGWSWADVICLSGQWPFFPCSETKILQQLTSRTTPGTEEDNLKWRAPSIVAAWTINDGELEFPNTPTLTRHHTLIWLTLSLPRCLKYHFSTTTEETNGTLSSVSLLGCFAINYFCQRPCLSQLSVVQGSRSVSVYFHPYYFYINV